MLEQSSKIPNADLVKHPERLWTWSTTEMYSMEPDDVRSFQLDAFRHRFATLAPMIPTIRKLADAQRLTKIDDLTEIAPLLLKHSVYKSYPLSFIEKAQFDRMTRWLGNLTTHDIAGLDTDGVETIDDWIDALDAQTPIRIRHSSGTSGKLSFIPASTVEDERAKRTWLTFFEGFGDEDSGNVTGLKDAPLVFANYRYGAMAQHRRMNALQQHLFGGDPAMIMTMNTGRLSADALSLGGRLVAASAKGELGDIALAPNIRARREEFVLAQAKAAEDAQQFFATLADRLGGRRIQLFGSGPQLFDMAVASLARGFRNAFAPDSVVMMGGGAKGRDLPADWLDTVSRFLGVTDIRDGYGMTEMTMSVRCCPHGHYHLPPLYILFVFDPKTGEQMPRTGVQQGRFGFYDLTRTDLWGGFLTGDAVTLHWGDLTPCRCGRNGAYLEKNIRRYSQEEGGDDKITCAAAPQAHDDALAFLNDVA